MQARNRLPVCVRILDQLKDEFHLGLVGLDRDFLIDSMDAEGKTDALWEEGRTWCCSTSGITQHSPHLSPHPLILLAFDPWGMGEAICEVSFDMLVISQGGR